jgi:hypothetical protein
MTINHDYTINNHVLDIVWPSIKKLIKYENANNFSANWLTFNLSLALV